jgi:hypothetical protein
MALSFTGITCWFLWQSTDLSRVAAFIPRSISLITLFLLIIRLLLKLNFSAKASSQDVGEEQHKSGRVIGAGQQASHWRAVLWIAVLPLLAWFLGLAAGVSMFSLAFLRLFAAESWKFSITFAIVLWMVIQLVFSAVLNIPLYGGMMAGVLI